MRSTSKYASRDRVEGASKACDTHADLIDAEAAACRLLAFRDDFSDSEALQDCHRRLLTRGTSSWVEADRIVAAIAERLGWAAPTWARGP